MTTTTMNQSKVFMDLENQYGAHNYHSLPVVISKGEGVFLWDVDGKVFRTRMQTIIDKYPIVLLVRGKGLLNAIVVDDDEDGHMAWDMCIQLAARGLLAKPTHGNIIRFAPPLVMTEDQLLECCDIIEEVIAHFTK